MKFIRPATLSLCIVLLAGCVQPGPNSRPWLLTTTAIPPTELPDNPQVTQEIILPTRNPSLPIYTPTPDAPHTLPTLRTDAEQYTVQYGDSLAGIASMYNLDVSMLIEANSLVNPNYLEVGQVLNIPAPQPTLESSDFKIIPDSELVNGPFSATLDVDGFIRHQGGYLSKYSEEVDEVTLDGSQILARIANEYSVNPRLLLALLEYQSGWVTRSNPSETTLKMPMGLKDENRLGLYRQLAWTANQLNRGYYLWQVNGISYLILSDGNLVALSPNVNAGTVGVQAALSRLMSASKWQQAVSDQGVFAVYEQLFGSPFDYTVEPLIPSDLSQPVMQLPFEQGVAWSFTGGPHASWGDGSAWGALDFSPPGDSYGCFESNAWVTAVTDGIIVRSENGEVILDLDGDGLEQTGWTVLYMHIGSQERVAAGTQVKIGDRIGHASCEGGVSTGTHFHIARRYNGQWISADGSNPFNLDGWISSGDSVEYDGTLTRGDHQVIAWEGRIAENQIER